MSRSLVLGLVVAAAFGLWSSVEGAEPAFNADFSTGFRSDAFDCDSVVNGGAGAAFSAVAYAQLTSENNETVGTPDEAGAQGWTVSIAAENLMIDTITLEGTDAQPALAGGFEQTEVSPPEGLPNENGDECTGLTGAVSAVVLSLTKPVTLDPEGTADIAVMDVSGQFPANQDESLPVRLLFADGCKGSGQPVLNKVTFKGSTLFPTKGECAFTLFVPPPPPSACHDDGVPAVLYFRTSNDTVEDVGTTYADAPADYDCSEIDVASTILREIAAPSPLEDEIYVGLSENITTGDPPAGAQGWTISVSVDGPDVTLVTDSVTLVGTVAEGALAGGFEQTEAVDPLAEPGGDIVGAQGQGAVSAVVLHLTKPVTLEPVGSATILLMTVAADREPVDPSDTIVVTMKALNGLKGSGQPVQNKATIAGQTVFMKWAAPTELVLARPAGPQVDNFIRCDANDDGKNDIADSIYIINELYRGGPPTACPDAADCNDDEMVDLSDAIYGIEYQFLSGDPPPAPFPGCGADDDQTEASCPKDSTSC